MTISLRGRLLALTFLVALVAAACGGNSNDAASSGGGSTGGTTTGASSSSGGSSRYGGSGDSEDTGATGGGDGMDSGESEDGPSVQANNFAFDPTTVKVESGEDLYLKNGNANTPHTFTVDGTDIDVNLDPLASDEVKIDLDPGTYDFHCEIHPQMTGTLTVT